MRAGGVFSQSQHDNNTHSAYHYPQTYFSVVGNPDVIRTWLRAMNEKAAKSKESVIRHSSGLFPASWLAVIPFLLSGIVPNCVCAKRLTANKVTGANSSWSWRCSFRSEVACWSFSRFQCTIDTLSWRGGHSYVSALSPQSRKRSWKKDKGKA